MAKNSTKKEEIKEKVSRDNWRLADMCNSCGSQIWSLVMVVVVIGSGVFLWQRYVSQDYWAVHVKTGEVYFGQMVSVPWLYLRNVYLLQQTGDRDNPYSISKFDKAIWGPEDKLYISRGAVIWKARVAEDSKVIAYFNNPDKVLSQLPPIVNNNEE